jgi:hypothetical protein
MRSVVGLVFAVLLAATLVGCGGQNGDRAPISEYLWNTTLPTITTTTTPRVPPSREPLAEATRTSSDG